MSLWYRDGSVTLSVQSLLISLRVRIMGAPNAPSHPDLSRSRRATTQCPRKAANPPAARSCPKVLGLFEGAFDDRELMLRPLHFDEHSGRCRGPWSPIFNLMARKQSGNRSRKTQRRPTRRGPTELGMLNSRADSPVQEKPMGWR